MVFTTMWAGLAVMQKNRPYGESAITPVIASTVEEPSKRPSLWHWGYTYEQAQARYTKRLEITRCGQHERTLNLKKGYPFMLENRDTETHTFSFDGQTYELPSGDFALAIAATSGSLEVACDGEASGRVVVK